MREKFQKAYVAFKEGAGYFFKGQKFVWSDHREILKICTIPMVFGFLIFMSAGFGFITYFDDLMAYVWEKPDWWLLLIAWYIVVTLVVVAMVVTTSILAGLTFMIVAALFNDYISERVEVIEKSWDSDIPFSWSFLLKDAGHSIVFELAKILKKLMWLAPLYVLSLIIPVVGNAIYLVVGGYKMSEMFGMDYIDWSLARRGYSWEDRFNFAKENRTILLGFGFMMTLVFMIPLGGVVFWPGAIAGGTLLCNRLNPDDKRDKTPGKSLK